MDTKSKPTPAPHCGTYSSCDLDLCGLQDVRLTLFTVVSRIYFFKAEQFYKVGSRTVLSTCFWFWYCVWLLYNSCTVLTAFKIELHHRAVSKGFQYANRNLFNYNVIIRYCQKLIISNFIIKYGWFKTCNNAYSR